MTTLITKRLRLEPINESHLEGLCKLNSDPLVMRFISGKAETREETIAMISRVQERWAEFGYSWWSFIDIENNEIIGAGCIQHLGRDRANPLEIGWRLRPDKWHQGYASEAARSMARFAFEELQAETLCAVCMPENTDSSIVMIKLGMTYKGLEHWYNEETAVYSMTKSTWFDTFNASNSIQ
ncbi:GNAT family N-acetyltransferase [Undibacterium sp. SXout20W]|uniref:GNAT family N-acetyltransferase n=1 Tax=Undibacterium sp. SXout20W TaxID=3413051 RepID=UPI003BEF6E78